MVIKEGYKQTEIGIIPNDWELMKLGDIFEFKNGLNKEKHFFGYGTPILNYMDVFKYSGVIANDIKGKVFLTNQELKAYEVRKGDVFFTRTSETIEEIGVTTTVLEDVLDTVFSGFVLRGRSKNAILDLYFKKYCFSSSFVRKEIISTASYTTRALTNGRLLANVKIAVPTLAEQTAIANALSDADALITSLEKLIAKKRNIKQGTMQQLLQPKEGWEVKKLGEVATIVRGASPRPIEDTKWFDKQSPIGWVRISDVTKSKKVLLETTQKLSDLGVKNSRLVENGNLIMSICATVGRPILTTFDVCIHDGFVVFKNPQVDRQYLYYFLTFIEDNWAKSGQTGSQMNLNTTLINNTEIPFPKSPEEQTRIATILSDMDAELTVLEQKLEKYKKIKLGMMQELLTGRTRLV